MSARLTSPREHAREHCRARESLTFHSPKSRRGHGIRYANLVYAVPLVFGSYDVPLFSYSEASLSQSMSPVFSCPMFLNSLPFPFVGFLPECTR